MLNCPPPISCPIGRFDVIILVQGGLNIHDNVMQNIDEGVHDTDKSNSINYLGSMSAVGSLYAFSSTPLLFPFVPILFSSLIRLSSTPRSNKRCVASLVSPWYRDMYLKIQERDH